MRRKLVQTVWLAAIVTGLAWLALAPALAGDNKELKKQMAQTHRGENSPLSKLARQLEAAEPDWKVVESSVAKLQEMGQALAKIKEKSPSQVSYGKAVAALDEAARKSDRPAAMEAHKRLMQSCNGCHYGGPPLKEK